MSDGGRQQALAAGTGRMWVGILLVPVLLAAGAPGLWAGRRSSALCLGLVGGWFKPNTLAQESSVSPFDSVATSQWWGVQLTSPGFGGTTLRLSTGMWTWRRQGELTILPLALDVKHEVIQGLAVRPYVAYGGALYWGWEGGWREVGRRPGEARGWGATLGVGLDVHLSRHWRAAAEFDYLYLMFRRDLRQARDYSGPRLLLGVNYSL